jgi:hypothetical protein
MGGGFLPDDASSKTDNTKVISIKIFLSLILLIFRNVILTLKLLGQLLLNRFWPSVSLWKVMTFCWITNHLLWYYAYI